MGKSSKSKSTNEPSAYAKGYITPAANALQSAYAQTAPQAAQIGQNIFAQLPGLSEKAFGANPMLDAATGYNTDVLGGKYLDAGNPYIQDMIAQTGDSVTNRVQSAFSSAGRTGSGANQYTLGKSLAEAENELRYRNYGAEREAMGQAAALAPSLNAAGYQGLGSYLAAAQAATGIPMNAAQQYAAGTGGLVGQYNTQTNTQTPSGWQSFKDVVGTGAQVAGIISDRRLKRDIERVGEDADGLGRYRYRYLWDAQDAPLRDGVMADEVARLRPWALGPMLGEFNTVNMEAL